MYLGRSTSSFTQDTLANCFCVCLHLSDNWNSDIQNNICVSLDAARSATQYIFLPPLCWLYQSCFSISSPILSGFYPYIMVAKLCSMAPSLEVFSSLILQFLKIHFRIKHFDTILLASHCLSHLFTLALLLPWLNTSPVRLGGLFLMPPHLYGCAVRLSQTR